MSFDHETDPYGKLTYVIGDEEDFWCFDYAISEDRKRVRLHAVINSETGHFIMNATEPSEVSEADAVLAATELVSNALEWCNENDVAHDVEGWNQDVSFFWRSLQADLAGWKECVPSRV